MPFYKTTRFPRNRWLLRRVCGTMGSFCYLHSEMHRFSDEENPISVISPACKNLVRCAMLRLIDERAGAGIMTEAPGTRSDDRDIV